MNGMHLRARVYTKLICANPGESLNYYVSKGFDIHNPLLEESLVLHFWIPLAQWERFETMVEKRGERCERVKILGGASNLKQIQGRLPLCAVLVMMLLFALYAPQRIWFLQVEGNHSVTVGEILTAAQTCGLSFWEKADAVNSQIFKDKILNELPQLQWAGLDFSGGIATIRVRERLEGEDVQENGGVADVVASRDGLIVSMSTLDGQALCQVGQAVTEGEILISGCIEHEYQNQYTCAHGEVYALTQRQIQAAMPSQWIQKTYNSKSDRSVYLIFGRNKIKIFGNSGISGMSCDKMRTVKRLTLPGGYVLPFSLVVEEVRSFQPEKNIKLPQTESSIVQYIDDYVDQQMVAGEILDKKIQFGEQEGILKLNAVYSCREMISREKKVLWFEGDGTNDRTDRKRGESGGLD